MRQFQLYGRRQDRPLTQRQKSLMSEILPKAAMPDPSGAALDLSALFPGKASVWLEVGFGGGEHLAWQAAHNPEVGLIGAEPFVNGVAKLVTKVAEQDLQNVRIHHGDARPLMEALPAASLEKLFVLFPDPWPKARHHRRRIINHAFLDAAARLLKPGGELRIASDIPDYIAWSLLHVAPRKEFRWTAETPADWRIRPDDWPQTRYEAKAERAGRVSSYLTFVRV